MDEIEDDGWVTVYATGQQRRVQVEFMPFSALVTVQQLKLIAGDAELPPVGASRSYVLPGSGVRLRVDRLSEDETKVHLSAPLQDADVGGRDVHGRSQRR